MIGVVGLFHWRNQVIHRQNQSALADAQAAIQGEDARNALALINSRPPSAQGEEEVEAAWRQAEIEASARLGWISRLQSLHQQNPTAVLQNEDASLMLARSFLHGGAPHKSVELRQYWDKRTSRPHLWFALDVDTLLLSGESDKARNLLTGRKFSGPNDSGRLSRLALVSANRSLTNAWELLADAYEANPKDTDVRSFRGQVFETLGSNRLARVEYVAAHVATPDNFLLRDQLGDFYRRQFSFANALTTWLPALTNDVPAYLRLKSAFWSRVTQPVTLPDLTRTNSADSLQPLVNYVAQLAPGRFWDSDAFSLLADNAIFVRDRREVFWLRLIEDLRNQDFDQAFDHLNANRFRQGSWDITLLASIHRILNHRRTGQLNPPELDYQVPTTVTNRHSFLADIDHHAHAERDNGKSNLPAELRQALAMDEAPALAFLAAGWINAGLAILGDKNWPPETPVWIPYSVTQARRLIHGPTNALDYARKQPASRELSLLIGELLLATGDPDRGMEQLQSIAHSPTELGYRAAWLLSVTALDRGHLEIAESALETQPKLKNSTTGREILAKVHFLRGDTNATERIYRQIISTSIEARIYLASLAFDRKDWSTASNLTAQLQFLMPDEMQFRANMRAITAAQTAIAKPSAAR